ncbi:MAG: M28 family peptidase [Chitinophagales bacterium]|nr:M28 family peptidase [Chitinophagales bacterium]
MSTAKYILLAYIPFLFACQGNQNEHAEPVVENKESSIDIHSLPPFNADSAYAFVAKQVSFGPRVPNSEGHAQCAAWMIALLKSYADTVIVQKADLKAFDGKILHAKNIIASFNPQSETRIMLSAHWDTRPFADQDSKDQDKPIDGANDGASGVGILLEIARAYNIQKPSIGVDIILWDAEDYGQPADSKFPEMEDSYCLGSQYWAKNMHRPNYTAKWGILLDMCGALGASFSKEQQSVKFAGNLVDRTWQNAQTLGYSSIFLQEYGDPIIDDHYYINTLAHIPTIDIIHRTNSTRSGFGPYWHTHNDNMNSIDKNVLRAVGETVIYTVAQEK